MASLPAVYEVIGSKINLTQTRWRWILAGPAAFILAILLMATLPLILPVGNGGINNLVVPVVLFPLKWALFCILPVATERLEICVFWYFILSTLCLITLIFNFVF